MKSSGIAGHVVISLFMASVLIFSACTRKPPAIKEGDYIPDIGTVPQDYAPSVTMPHYTPIRNGAGRLTVTVENRGTLPDILVLTGSIVGCQSDLSQLQTIDQLDAGEVRYFNLHITCPESVSGEVGSITIHAQSQSAPHIVDSARTTLRVEKSLFFFLLHRLIKLP